MFALKSMFGSDILVTFTKQYAAFGNLLHTFANRSLRSLKMSTFWSDGSLLDTMLMEPIKSRHVTLKGEGHTLVVSIYTISTSWYMYIECVHNTTVVFLGSISMYVFTWYLGLRKLIIHNGSATLFPISSKNDNRCVLICFYICFILRTENRPTVRAASI